jgi:predicted ATPase
VTRHLERVEWRPRPGTRTDTWPYTIPAVAQVVADGGLDVPDGVTFLVGENGSGKSTLVEALAAAYPRHGVENPFVNLLGDRGSPEDSPLGCDLRAVTNRMASPAGFFLRAETMHQVLGAADASPEQRRAWGGERVQERSHGESFTGSRSSRSCGTASPTRASTSSTSRRRRCRSPPASG